MNKLAPQQKDIEILLVDDQEDILENLKLFLETEPGLSVVGIAKDGLEALKKAKQLLPEVIVMDVKMPRMSGVEATRHLRDVYPEMNVILISMYDDKELIQKGKEAGAKSYFLKGTAMQILIDEIRRLS